MQAIPIHQAKANLSKYIAAAKHGTPVYIGSYGQVEVMLVAVPKDLGQTPLHGAFRGKLWKSGSAWGRATDQVSQDFENSLTGEL